MDGSSVRLSEGQTAESGWMPANVPGDVHLDLLANKKIPDPYSRDNEAKLQWIENESWEYRLDFDVTAALLARTNVDLVFDGLDAAANVFVNGEQVLSANNMFRVWRVPVKSDLHVGQECAACGVSFADQGGGGGCGARSMAGEDEGGSEDVCTQSSLRVWMGLGSEVCDQRDLAAGAIGGVGQGADCGFRNPAARCEQDVAHVDAEVEVEAASAGLARVSVQYANGGKPVTEIATVSVHAGRNTIDLPIEIRQPRLWYPAGYGEQPLYEFTAQVGVGRRYGRVKDSEGRLAVD